MRIIKLRDLKITKIQEDGSFEPYPVWESEYYKALSQGDHNIYDNYHKLLEKHHYKNPITNTEEISYKEFIELYHTIYTIGFIIKEPYIKISDELYVTDGQHRIAILYYLNPERSVRVDEENSVIEIIGQR